MAPAAAETASGSVAGANFGAIRDAAAQKEFFQFFSSKGGPGSEALL
jgi:hypothetical protein